jgi:hypothetical protein
MAKQPRLWKASSFHKLKAGEIGYVSKSATKYRCPMCGTVAPFVGHHVHGPFASKKAKRASKEIVLVCLNCHDKIHAKKWTT